MRPGKEPQRADRHVDALYGAMRRRYGNRKAGANGYRSHGFFRREQHVVLIELAEAVRARPPGREPIVDIACGSGLMLGDPPAGTGPLAWAEEALVGLDFNARACRDAAANGLRTIQGDAYALPFATSGIAHAVNCQFLNQQPCPAVGPFLAECHRCLVPGGRLILLWRRADSFLHRGAHAVLSALDTVTGLPAFPQFDHRQDTVAAAAEAIGFDVLRRGVTLPIASAGAAPRIIDPRSGLARIAGASNLLVLGKPMP